MVDTQLQLPERGATVTAVDGHLGTVNEVIVRPATGALAYLVVGRGLLDGPITVPAGLIESIPNPHDVHLRVTRDEASRQGALRSADDLFARQDGDTVRIPLLEERLVASKRLVDLGELRVHTGVDTEERPIRQAVTRDELVVERVAVNRPLSEPATARYEGDRLIIPIMQEVLVVEKRLMLVEEVHISTRQVTEDRELRETVRRTRVDLEDATAHGVRGLPPTSVDAPDGPRVSISPRRTVADADRRAETDMMAPEGPAAVGSRSPEMSAAALPHTIS